MSNDYYNASGNPGTRSTRSSAIIRGEFTSIEGLAAKLVPLAGNAGKFVLVNSSGNAQDASTSFSQSGSNLTYSGSGTFTFSGTTLSLTGAAAFTMAGTGALTHTSTGVVSFSQPSTFTVTSTGAKTFNGSGNLVVAGGGTFDFSGGGAFNVTAAATHSAATGVIPLTAQNNNSGNQVLSAFKNTATGANLTVNAVGVNAAYAVGTTVGDVVVRHEAANLYFAAASGFSVGFGRASGAGSITLNGSGGAVIADPASGATLTTTSVDLYPPGALPAVVSTKPVISAGGGSPNSGRLFIGDGTGWKFHFSRRVGSVTTDQLTVWDNGRLSGKALHNNAGSVLGTTDQFIASGTYVPTLSNTLNIGSSTAFVCQWMRVGNVVTASGFVSMSVTTNGIPTTLLMSLPIPSSITALEQLGGVASFSTGGNFTCGINGDVAGDVASFNFTATATGTHQFSFSFTYLIQ